MKRIQPPPPPAPPGYSVQDRLAICNIATHVYAGMVGGLWMEHGGANIELVKSERLPEQAIGYAKLLLDTFQKKGL